MPEDLKARVQAAAEANNRSMNAEIIYRLQTTFEMDDYQPKVNAQPDTGHSVPDTDDLADVLRHVGAIINEAMKREPKG